MEGREMTTLAKVKRLATKLNATVIDDKCYQVHECRVEAPHGFVWNDGVHEMVDCANRPWKPDYDDILSRMEFGIKPCPLGDDCEGCYPED